MTENNDAPKLAPPDEVNLLDVLLVLARNKALIIKPTVAATLLALGYALLLPNIYTASTKILPPQQSQTSASAMLGQLGGLSGLTSGALGIRNPNDYYLAMLKSRTLQEKIVKRFDLKQVYQDTTLTGTLNKLENSTAVSSGKDGVIAVDVNDTDPRRAADIANAYIDELNTMVQTNALTDASVKRVFFEQRLRQAKDELSDAEFKLDKTPSTSLHYGDAVRNVKYQGALWEILARQFEMARLDEAKNFTSIQALDKATPPEEPAKPGRKLIVILSALLAFAAAVTWTLLSEYMRHDINPAARALRWQELRKTLRFTEHRQ